MRVYARPAVVGLGALGAFAMPGRSRDVPAQDDVAEPLAEAA